MLHGHRRALLREATGPSVGELSGSAINVLVGAFSDAQVFEDPWTPENWAGAEWAPASLSRASAPGRPPYRGEAMPFMIGNIYSGDLRMVPTWSQPEIGEWEPEGIGDFRTSEVYSALPEGTRSRMGKYKGEAIPFMVGDLRVFPAWSQPEIGEWEPEGIGDFRTSEVYSGWPTGDYSRMGRYKGEAIPFMVGDLPSGPEWSQPEIGQWEPRGIGDFRSSWIYGRMGRKYYGDAIPTMIGAVWRRRTREERIKGRQQKHQKAVYRAARALSAWARKKRIPIIKALSGLSTDGTAWAFGALLSAPSANDRIQIGNKAKQLARVHRTFYNMSPRGHGKVLVYFTDDPAAFMVQMLPTTGQEYLAYVAEVGALFKRSPEKMKARMLALQELYTMGQFGLFRTKRGTLRRINRLRRKLGMDPWDPEAELDEVEASMGLVHVGRMGGGGGRGGRRGGRGGRGPQPFESLSPRKQRRRLRYCRQLMSQMGGGGYPDGGFGGGGAFRGGSGFRGGFRDGGPPPVPVGPGPQEFYGGGGGYQSYGLDDLEDD